MTGSFSLAFIGLGIILSPAHFLNSTENLNWVSRHIQLSVQRNNSDAPVPTSISPRAGTEEIAVVGDDHLVRIKNRSTGKLVRILENHSDWIKMARYRPQSDRLYTAGADRRIMNWHADNEDDFRLLAREDRAINDFDFDKDGKFLATVGFNSRLYVYDLNLGKRIKVLKCACGDNRVVRFADQGNSLIVGGRNGKVRVFQWKTGKITNDLHVHKKRIRDMLVLEDGNQIATCSDDRSVRITDLKTGKTRKVFEARARLYSIANLDGNRVVVGGSDNLIHIVSPESGAMGQLSGHHGTVCDLCVDENKLISASFDTQIRIWTIADQFIKHVPVNPAATTRQVKTTRINRPLKDSRPKLNSSSFSGFKTETKPENTNQSLQISESTATDGNRKSEFGGSFQIAK